VKLSLLFALLAIPAAHGAPRQFPAKKATSPPKALVVEKHPTTAKIYVSTSGAGKIAKAKPNNLTKNGKAAARKAARPTTPANDWHFVPKFEEGGKDDTTYGFLFKRRF
jgi:hypothetical protein